MKEISVVFCLWRYLRDRICESNLLSLCFFFSSQFYVFQFTCDMVLFLHFVVAISDWERQFFFLLTEIGEALGLMVRAGTAQVKGLHWVAGITHLLAPGLYCTCTVQSLMELWVWLLLPPRHQCNVKNNHNIFSSESLKLCCFNTVCRSWQNRLCLCSRGCGVLDEIFSWDLKRHSES